MQVLVLAVDPQALITEIRLRTPLCRWAESRGAQLRWLGYHEARRGDLDSADLVIAQRPVVDRHLALIRLARQGAAPVVVELDDLLSEPPDHLLHSAVMRAHAMNLPQALWLADVVCVSTPRLQAALSLPDEKTVTVPNHAAPLATPEVHAALEPGWLPPGPTVLLAASDRLWPGHLLEALRRLQAAHGVGLVAVGPAACGLEDAGLRVQRLPSLSRPQFMALAARLPRAVGAIPLDNSRFSACKSAIKWMDWARAGLPVVAQNLPPYADAITPEVTGALVDDDVEAWDQALQRALFDDDWRQRITQAAQAEVAHRHCLARSVEAWTLALDRAVARRALRPADPRPASAAFRGWCAAWGARLRGWNRQRLARRQASR